MRSRIRERAEPTPPGCLAPGDFCPDRVSVTPFSDGPTPQLPRGNRAASILVRAATRSPYVPQQYAAALDRGKIASVMRSFRWLLLFATLGLAASALRADDVTYPPGSRIGLIPPSGMVTSRSFFGFEDPENNVVIMLVALPGQA
ncbi:MAG TPA: hypothetical protein VIB38_07260, partial [Aestuariivirgaceae bacterium]